MKSKTKKKTTKKKISKIVESPSYTKLPVYIAHNECGCNGILCIMYTEKLKSNFNSRSKIYEKCLNCNETDVISYASYKEDYTISDHDFLILYLI